MMIFDTHAHYDDEKFDADREQVLSSLPGKGIALVLNAASDLESSRFSAALSAKHDFVYASAGVHPHEAKNGFDVDEISKLLSDPKVVAIGEAGLDYHYDFSPRDSQINVFEAQLALAVDLDVPIIIHNREAHNDSFELVKKHRGVKGVFHCFSGSPEMALELVKLGMYISFAGPVTFSNARKTVEVLRSIPLSKVLAETDCPYLAPVPHRGERNDSGLISHTILKMAEIRGVSAEEMAHVTMQNGRELFKI